MGLSKVEILEDLRADILRLQGHKTHTDPFFSAGLGPILKSFPQNAFPIGAIHEFITSKQQSQASTTGFVLGILSGLMGKNGALVWISDTRVVFPPAFNHYGVSPDQIVFVNLRKEKEVMWAMEEALKCNGLSAVVAEVKNLSFTTSRRLQLAVEESLVTGFVLNSSNRANPTACVTRWQVSSVQSDSTGLPGVGFPRWQVTLLKVRNGKPGTWTLQWIGGRFEFHSHEVSESKFSQMKVG